jgi:hypothetical protein
MAFAVLYPPAAGGRGGYGLRTRVQSSLPFTIGDYVRGILSPNGGLATDIVCEAFAPIAGASRLSDLFWGMNLVTGVPALMQLGGPAGLYSSTIDLLCDLLVEKYDATNTLTDSTNFLAQLTHDPVTGAGRFTLEQLWPRFDEVLIAIAALGPVAAVSFRATSAALAGTGTIALSGEYGALVTLTTVPASWGSTSDTPRRLIPSAGRVQFPIGTDYPDGAPIRYERQMVYSDAGYSTLLRYNFKPGIIASITPFDRA